MSCQGLAYSRCRFSGYSTALSGVTRLGNNSILLISCMSSREIETLNLQQKRSTSEANRFSILDGWINLSHGTPFCQNNCATLMRAAFCWFCQITVASHYQRLQSIFDCPHDRVQHFRLMKLAEPYTCRADGPRSSQAFSINEASWAAHLQSGRTLNFSKLSSTTLDCPVTETHSTTLYELPRSTPAKALTNIYNLLNQIAICSWRKVLDKITARPA